MTTVAMHCIRVRHTAVSISAVILTAGTAFYLHNLRNETHMSHSKGSRGDTGRSRSSSVVYAGAAELRNRDRRQLLIAATASIGAAGLGIATTPFIASLGPSERARALGGPAKVNLATIKPTQQVTISWRGRPVWVLHRTQQMLDRLKDPELIAKLRDPASATKSQQPDYAQNETRSIRPQYLVVVGICTHLGCVPAYSPEASAQDRNSVWASSYYCPCHGSRFDLAGRVAKGVPAPTNLVVPPHRYLDSNTVEVGVDHA